MRLGALGAALALVTVAPAAAQDIAVLGVRIGADAGDVAATGEFYAEAFGLKEVNRFGGDEPFEVIMNFGDTVEAAAISNAAQVVIMARDADAPADAMAHLIFAVSDIEASFAQAVAAGATPAQEPTEFENSGVFVAFLEDPEGNSVELLQFPAPPAGE